MEIKEYNGLQLANETSSLTNSINVKTLEKIEYAKTEIETDTFAIDFDSIDKKSDFSNSLKDFISNISSAQISLQTLEKQSVILNDIQNIINKIPENSTQIEIDTNQPNIENGISNYNSLTLTINKEFEKSQQDTTSRTYFDGMLGAKPLSTEELIETIKQQTAVIEQEKSFFAEEINKNEQKAIENIVSEIDKSNQQAPFKNIDFGKNMADFSSANINSIIGSVALSQANAIPAHSPKLLA